MIPVLKTKWLGPYTSKEEASEAIKKEIPADADILRIKYKTFEWVHPNVIILDCKLFCIYFKMLL